MFPEAPRRNRTPVTVGVLLLLVGFGVAGLPWAALASAVVEIVQKNRAFEARDVAVAPGTILRFTNQDDFPHQIHVTGPDMNFDSPLQVSGQVVDVTLPKTGVFEVRCGIHPRMRLSVTVQ